MTIVKDITINKTARDKRKELKMERKLDLEHLKRMKKSGKLDLKKTVYSSLDKIADDLQKCRNSDELYHRMFLAQYGRDDDLDRLVHDPDWFVRELVAINGRDKDLDILVYDEDALIRRAVVAHGRKKDLIELIGDKSIFVRQEIVKQLKEQR